MVRGVNMKYKIKGKIRFGSGSERSFERVVEAKSKEHAKDVLMALFGSNNGVKRTAIDIESIEEA